ncbi:hypothetical protein E2C01_096935 [Portunus trituberculatus]|uniref:Uncharacterized protein n=1 Tax=Portunus trituberculatus TaxID=210409 RepID=A0A5B7K864_PORTR|nr:hypothetical protein [Portunus trituberculatus]
MLSYTSSLSLVPQDKPHLSLQVPLTKTTFIITGNLFLLLRSRQPLLFIMFKRALCSCGPVSISTLIQFLFKTMHTRY